MKQLLRWLVFCAILIVTVLAANFVFERHSYGDFLDFLLPVAAMAICASVALLLSNLALACHYRQFGRDGIWCFW